MPTISGAIITTSGAADGAGFATRVTADTFDRFHIKSDRMMFGMGNAAASAKLLLAQDGGATREYLTFSRNVASSMLGIRVLNDDATAASAQAISGFYPWAQNGAGDYYRGSIHTYGANYSVAAFIGYTNFSNDSGNGTILRSIHATTANVRIFAGTTGGFADEIANFTPTGMTLIGLQRYGGITSSFPALRRATTRLQVRLADDSGAAALEAAGLSCSLGTGLCVEVANTPASAAAAGLAGTICWDTGFVYVCTATNTWKRVAIATW